MSTEIVSATIGSTPYRVTLSEGAHQWFGDAPQNLGGGASGPSPHQLLLSALGACTAITVSMYAQRKGLALEGIDVELFISAEQLTPPALTQIERRIDLHGALDEAQRARLLDIANACPLHKLLSGEIRIDTQLQG
ncbi:OsmC family peroxiredoxin [Pseudomonas cavernae]|uniref:OsmC family peroxiredoxin n=1 Tax=Pseudomonas cavernae TaxID=2320867 RepID=A0A385Z1X2_9PSED|nr:OsmC family protein [Pseudomonas cavernae]AYC32480.1 OsmC family peroxiredoxin [Pseudomonas cavernae]